MMTLYILYPGMFNTILPVFFINGIGPRVSCWLTRILHCSFIPNDKEIYCTFLINPLLPTAYDEEAELKQLIQRHSRSLRLRLHRE